MAKEVRCPSCRKKLCEVTGTAKVEAKCPRCSKSFTIHVSLAPGLSGRSGTV